MLLVPVNLKHLLAVKIKCTKTMNENHSLLSFPCTSIMNQVGIEKSATGTKSTYIVNCKNKKIPNLISQDLHNNRYKIKAQEIKKKTSKEGFDEE